MVSDKKTSNTRKKRWISRYRKKGMWGSIKRANSMARRALYSNMPEEKVVDDTFAATAVLNTGTVQLLNGIAEGQSITGRIGAKVCNKNIFIRAAFNHNSAGIDSQFLRFIVIHDSNSNGAAPTLTDILSDNDNYLSPLNPVTSDRFTVLCDELISLPNDGENCKTIKCYRQLFNSKRYKKDLKYTQYSGSGDTVTSIASGAYYIAALSNLGANGPFMQYFSRIRYVDN